ncbi:MAG: N-acetylmuramic acid 6-phosphate etherase [Verrucomicrobia bacterium]|nr:N-acetylmuramic acid 6-phosphate etherase [Verrucomicrobiota bacterium]
MTNARDGVPSRLFLGIEGGATHTQALIADASGQLLARTESGPANVQLLGETQLLTLLRGLRRALPRPDAIAIGLAGARTEPDRQRIRQAAARIWPGIPCYATNDLETALMAADSRHHRDPIEPARVLVLSGTGSCCYGRAADGRTLKIGGWGHLLGDRGSAYDIGLRALRETLRHFDRTNRLTPLGTRLLRRLQSNSPEAWVGWIQTAEKAAIAALAPEVFAVHANDPLARKVVRAAAADLATDACACADQLRGRSDSLEFILAGGVLLQQATYARLVRRLIRAKLPRATVRQLSRPSAWGAVELARLHFPNATAGGSTHRPRNPLRLLPQTPARAIPCPSLDALALSPTEQRNPRSRRLSDLPLDQAIQLVLKEDRLIPPALLRERANLERAITWIVRALKQGGRLFYVGAGTSGRLGVLDASECPPTFRTSPELVQGIMAGGYRALWESIEGAEDDAQAGAEAARLRGVTGRDVVVGIAASGRTPFVWGAIWQARQAGAKTVLLCFNPHLEAPRGNRPDLIIAPDVGPELLTGSTRLKSGTATKLILNLFTTLTMVRLGKVVSNLMVDLNPSNAKLRDRAIRIVRQLTGGSEPEARAALEQAGWVVKRALSLRGLN